MKINFWKVSTLVCSGLLVGVVAWNRVPTASAAPEDPVAMEACDDQGHMEAALEHLRVARHELHEAVRHKGGHRVEAMKMTQGAINQVKQGCRFADDRRDTE